MKAGCFEGPTGSREECVVSGQNNLFTYKATRPLASGEQMSIVTGLNKGAVNVPPPLLTARARQFPADAFDINPLTVIISLLVLIAGIGLIVRFWLLHGRDRAYLTRYYLAPNDAPEHLAVVFHHEPVVVEFEPPLGLKPAQVGVILDESADTKDVTATIVDLAVRGFLTITDVPGVLVEGGVATAIEAGEAERLVDEGHFQGGIVPKLLAAVQAARGGVRAEIGETAVLA
jgi:hypothetical protein